jgi:hypothetical protein
MVTSEPSCLHRNFSGFIKAPVAVKEFYQLYQRSGGYTENLVIAAGLRQFA